MASRKTSAGAQTGAWPPDASPSLFDHGRGQASVGSEEEANLPVLQSSVCSVCRLTDEFPHHRDAALALLMFVDNLTFNQGGFLGHVAVSEALTPKQEDWLSKLLARNGFPPLAS